MSPPPESSRGRAVRAGIEGLIVALRGQRLAAFVDELGVGSTLSAGGDDGRLAAAAWRAMNLPLSGEGDGMEAHATSTWAYLERGATVGRYVVLRALGAGGMGVVYAAYDPELDRKVALKLVLPGRVDDEGRTRLLREAQALAKLSHRNVVAIHDVGTTGEQVWLAMEFVRGRTLGAWLREKPRPWREVLGVMRKAGRGLAAAHAAGLLHRDFKPDNVMVGEGGRVWVMDFGLARARPNVIALGPEESTQVPVPVVATLAMRVTQAGVLVGTPLYMAPEQLDGRGELTPAVDQFSLCVTLWEGLYGERPFGGKTFEELVVNVLGGRVREPPKGRAVPGWLRRVCERGLSVEPRQRFESMEGLLDALAKGQTRARVRTGFAAVGVLALLGAGGEGYRRLDVAQRVATCEASGAEVEAAWNPERRQQLHDGLVATGVSYAATTAEKVMPWLERQAEAWREARVEACLDAEVRGRWSAETLERSLWCLDERRTQLESLVDELASADAVVVQKAVPVAAGLDSVDPCRDESVLASMVPPPPEDREAVRAVRVDVTRAGNLERAGRYERGLERARSALERAEALDWRPLEAEARWRVGRLLQNTGAYAEAEKALEEAYFEAAGGVAPELAFASAKGLVSVVGVSSSRYSEGQRWGRHAEVALASVRDGERLRSASLLGELAGTYRISGAYDEARALGERALSLNERALGPEHPEVAQSLISLANVHASTGAYDEAKSLLERALSLQEKALGPEHPDVAGSLNNLAIVHKDTGAYDEAKSLLERALAIREKALGAEHPHVAQSLTNLATVHAHTGAYDEAKSLLERALAIREKALGPGHPDVALSLNNLAGLHFHTGEYDEARSLWVRALAIWEQALGAEHPDVATSLMNLANVHIVTGAYDEAKLLHERALAINERALGPEHPGVAMSLDNLAIIHESTGAYNEAKRFHERALSIREKALGPEHPDVATSLNNLASVHASTGAYDEAKRLHEHALSIREKALGPEHPDVADSLNNLANIHYHTGAYDEARRLHERALSIQEKALGPEHPKLGYALVGLAMVALEQRRPVDAVPLAQRAVDVRQKGDAPPVDLARARFVLARALWDAPVDHGRDRPRAVSLAEQARDGFRASDKGGAKDFAEVEQWLRDHGGGR